MYKPISIEPFTLFWGTQTQRSVQVYSGCLYISLSLFSGAAHTCSSACSISSAVLNLIHLSPQRRDRADPWYIHCWKAPHTTPLHFNKIKQKWNYISISLMCDLYLSVFVPLSCLLCYYFAAAAAATTTDIIQIQSLGSPYLYHCKLQTGNVKCDQATSVWAASIKVLYCCHTAPCSTQSLLACSSAPSPVDHRRPHHLPSPRWAGAAESLWKLSGQRCYCP